MSVKLGMNLLLWGVEITPKHLPIIEMIQSAGFDGIELPIVDAKTQQLKVLARACDDLGLARTASIFMTPEVNPISTDAAIRRAALNIIKQRIDEAHSIDASVVAGGFHQAHKVFSGTAATPQEWQWCRDFLIEAGEYAAQAEIKLAVEFLNRFEAYLLNNSADSKRMIDEVDLPNVGVLYDTHHANIEDPDPMTALTDLKDRVNHIHISESHRGTLGTGQVDFAENFSAIEEIDYQGWLVIEAFGMGNGGIITAANIWRNAFESEEHLCRSGLNFIKMNFAHSLS